MSAGGGRAREPGAERRGGQAQGSAKGTWGPLPRIIDHITTGSTDPEARVRARTFVWSTALITVLVTGWGLGHFAFGNLEIPLLTLGCLGAAVLTWAKLWRDRDLVFASHVMVALMTLASAFGAYWTGGLRMTNVVPFMMVTVVAIMLLGRSGIFWSVLSLGIATAFQIGHWLGYPFPDLVPQPERSIDAAFTWMSSALVIFLFVASNDRSRRRLSLQLHAANRAKIDFLANVSHELRNPIHALLAVNAKLAASPLDDQQRALVATSQRTIGGLFTFLGDLVDSAALEQGSFQLVEGEVDVGRIVGEASAAARLLCDAKGLAFEHSLRGEHERRVRGDGRRLRQILTNVLSNAIRYTDAGQVRFRVRASPLDGGGASLWRFAVEDTGPGISPADMKRIFDKGVRLEPDDGRRGAGRGLAIAHELTTAMGGRISVADSVDGGARFTIEISFANAPLEGYATSPDRGPSAPDGGLRVLVVDDDEVNRELLEHMLDRIGQSVALAESGEAAIALVPEFEPHIILIDLRMPGWGGIATIRRTRALEQERGADPSFIVAVTADATDAARSAALAAGADDCLFKPFQADDIEALVARGLEVCTVQAAGES